MSDINDRIAKAKGWCLSEWYEDPGVPGTRSETPLHTHWYNPSKEMAERPDYVGTVEGLAGLMQEMMEEGFHPVWTPQREGYMCADTSWSHCWFSDLEHPGDCVGDAYLSEHRKEA